MKYIILSMLFVMSLSSCTGKNLSDATSTPKHDSTSPQQTNQSPENTLTQTGDTQSTSQNRNGILLFNDGTTIKSDSYDYLSEGNAHSLNEWPKNTNYTFEKDIKSWQVWDIQKNAVYLNVSQNSDGSFGHGLVLMKNTQGDLVKVWEGQETSSIKGLCKLVGANLDKDFLQNCQ